MLLIKIIKRCKAPVLFFLFALIAYSASAGSRWVLKKESEGIKIYTRDATGGVQMLKAEFTANGSPAQIMAFLLDIPAQKDWVYSTKSSVVLKRINARELIYYSEKSMPWPVTNRDAIMHLQIQQDPQTGIIKVAAYSVSDYMPAKKGIVRVPSSTVNWTITPTGNNTMSIHYEAMVDAGGSVPAWVVNMFITKGPLETFKKMRSILEDNPALAIK